MNQNKFYFDIELDLMKQKAFAWAQANAFSFVALLDNHQKNEAASDWESLLAVGARAQVSHRTTPPDSRSGLEKLQNFKNEYPNDWIFGFLGYDLKNEIEPSLRSENPDELDFPDLHFFVPQILIKIYENHLEIEADTGGGAFSIFQDLENQKTDHLWTSFDTQNPISIQSHFTKKEYLDTIEALREHIVAGDFYEINFCQAFFANKFSEKQLNPDNAFSLFWRLNSTARTPFSAFYRFEDRFLMSASPERFLRKRGKMLQSQPIKGTSRRGKTPEEDVFLKKTLQNDEKNRAENVMIVDLVRNDLARVCWAGSVEVTELFGIHSFETVHQMISTVEGKLHRSKNLSDILAATFPMGSMTGAPKVMAMQMIDHYERVRRSAYSGAVGYIGPSGDFDFSVVIRTILCNFAKNYLSFQVGGAIVFDSNAEAEWEECRLKMKTILNALGQNDDFLGA